MILCILPAWFTSRNTDKFMCTALGGCTRTRNDGRWWDIPKYLKTVSVSKFITRVLPLRTSTIVLASVVTKRIETNVGYLTYNESKHHRAQCPKTEWQLQYMVRRSPRTIFVGRTRNLTLFLLACRNVLGQLKSTTTTINLPNPCYFSLCTSWSGRENGYWASRSVDGQTVLLLWGRTDD